VDTPFILASSPSACAVDGNFALAKGEQPAVQQRSRPKFAPRPLAARQRGEEKERRDAGGHHVVEMGLDFGRIGSWVG
jgi:hypothetical protein